MSADPRALARFATDAPGESSAEIVAANREGRLTAGQAAQILKTSRVMRPVLAVFGGLFALITLAQARKGHFSLPELLAPPAFFVGPLVALAAWSERRTARAVERGKVGCIDDRVERVNYTYGSRNAFWIHIGGRRLFAGKPLGPAVAALTGKRIRAYYLEGLDSALSFEREDA